MRVHLGGHKSRKPNLPREPRRLACFASLAGLRLARPVICSGEGALFGRAADGHETGPIAYLDDEPLIDRSLPNCPAGALSTHEHFVKIY